MTEPDGPAGPRWGDPETAVAADVRDGPGVAVGDTEVVVVAAGGDPVPHPDALPRERGGDAVLSSTWPAATSALRMAALRTATVSRVSATIAGRCPAAEAVAAIWASASCRAVGVGVQPDLPAGDQGVEHPAGIVAGAHRQGQLRVTGVRCPLLRRRSVRVKRCTPSRTRCARRVHPADGQIQDPAAADRRQLTPVTEQRHPGLALVGDREQGAGGVLIQHPGLVDDQQIPAAAAAPPSAAPCRSSR